MDDCGEFATHKGALALELCVLQPSTTECGDCEGPTSAFASERPHECARAQVTDCFGPFRQ